MNKDNRSTSDEERDLVRAVTRAVVSRVGSAGPAVVEAVVAEVLSAMGTPGSSPAPGPGPRTNPGHKPTTPAAVPYTTPRGAQILPVHGAAAPSDEVCLACISQEKSRKRNRAVLTVTGRNTKGVVGRTASRIADLGGDILDISQTLVGDFFTMIIVIDIGSLATPFSQFQSEVTAAAKDLGCGAMMMHDDVLSALHRI